MYTVSLTKRSWIRSRIGRAVFIATAAGIAANAGSASASQNFPFFEGEVLSYRMQVGGLGTVAMGKMSVSGPTTIRGIPAVLLTSEFDSRVALFGGRDRTRSWLEEGRMRVLRYEKTERTPFSRREEAVDVFPAERRWVADNGDSGRTPTDAPLDELSFIYFIRTLPLPAGETYRFDRHFEAGRNPVDVRVLRRERIEVGAGSFDAIVVEMRVRDPRRHDGEAVLVLHLSDDDCRLPLRIESQVPRIGRTILSLEAHTHPAAHLAGR